MNIRIFIYIGVLFIFNSSQSMKIIKEKIKQKYVTKDKDTNIIRKEFFATQKILDNNKIFPQEIITNIREFCILLRNKDLEKNKPFAAKWNDFSIPVKYYPLLTSEQIDVIKYMLISKPIMGFHSNGCPPHMHYVLKSMDQYNQFIKLPIELREYLTVLPKSILEYQPYLQLQYSSIPINQNKTIQVKIKTANLLPHEGDFYDSISKPIIPEEYKKKNQKK